MTVQPRSLASHRPLKLGYLSPHNPFDRQSFSGTSHFAAKALSALPDVSLRVLGPHRPRRFLDRIAMPRPLKVEDLNLDGLDAVIGITATSLLREIQDRFREIPTVHVTDATPRYLRRAYGWAVPKTADRIEARVAARALLTAYSSQCIADRAREDLGLTELSPVAIPFGVNLEGLPESCPLKPNDGTLRLLFVGLDWVRKGGDVAIAALDQLRASGRNVELTVVGRVPPNLGKHPCVVQVGFLDKNQPAQEEIICDLYRQSHLLLLPSRGDCAPMVVAEAMAYGTPVIASDTGGIRDLLGGAGCGRLLPQSASPESWATAIADLTDDSEAYRMISEACFERAESRSWQVWAKELVRNFRMRASTSHSLEPAA